MNAPQASIMEWIATGLFALALIHTFSTKFFEGLAHRQPRHAGIWHLLGEVEIVFGFWSLVLITLMFLLSGKTVAIGYLESRDFTEAMFVFAIMVIAASRPILELAGGLVRGLARVLPLPQGMALYLVVMAVVPLLGSFITEPAAMTLAALMIRDIFFTEASSTRFKYMTLGVLFVNVSIGGTLTSFAAPPVLMVAAKWQLDTWTMMSVFGWKAALAVAFNAAAAMFWFRRELRDVELTTPDRSRRVPGALVLVHLLFLVGVVLFAHHPKMFLGLFMFFLGITAAYPRHQSPLILREAFLVAFFLAGLVVLAGMQQWWLQPLLMSMDEKSVFYGTAWLTALTDNAALTYLGSLVDGLSTDFKHALLAGAVTGGGLTVIANAPNPAGAAILGPKFSDGAIQPLGLLAAALLPTAVAIIAFRVL